MSIQQDLELEAVTVKKRKTTYTSDSERQHSGTLASLTFTVYSKLIYVMQG